MRCAVRFLRALVAVPDGIRELDGRLKAVEKLVGDVDAKVSELYVGEPTGARR